MFTDYIPTGREKAIKTSDLQQLTNSSRRELRQTVRSARLQGILICSDTQSDESGRKPGYFLPECREDVERTIRQMKSREQEIRKVRKALEKAMKKAYGD